MTPHASSLSVQGLTTTLADRDPPSKTWTKPCHYTVRTAEAAALSAPSCCFSFVLHPSSLTCTWELTEGRGVAYVRADWAVAGLCASVLHIQNAKHSHTLRGFGSIFPCCGGAAGIDQSCLIAAFNTPLSLQGAEGGAGSSLQPAMAGRGRKCWEEGRTRKWILWNSST